MKIQGLDGRVYQLTLENSPREDCSQYHKKCRDLLKELFPVDPVFEEVYLPGSYGLYADFLLPRRSLLIEVQGEQHYKEVRFFHKDRFKFVDGLRRDKLKKEWADVNQLRLCELRWDLDDWKERILA